MTDQLPEPDGLNDDSIAPDDGGVPFGEPGEASDPDIRNTTPEQDRDENAD